MQARPWHERGRGRGPQPDMLRRQEATGRSFAKFRGKRFDWAAGVTCAHLVRFHVKAMGHRVPPMPAFKSALGARRALEKLGHASMGDLLAGMKFAPIAPAEMLLGDLAVVPSGDWLDAVFVAGGNKLFGWWEGGGDTMTLLDLTEAWGSEIPANDEAPELAGKLLGDVVRCFRL